MRDRLQMSRFFRWLIVVTAALVIAALAGGHWFYQDLNRRATRAAEDQLQSIAQLKVQPMYTGEESGMFLMDMRYDYVGSGGNTFDWVPTNLPADITDEGQVFAPASVSGHLVFAVASDQVSGGVLMLEELSWDSEPVFFAVE
jgi:hypothetical protein